MSKVYEGVLVKFDGKSDLSGDSFSPNCKVKIANNVQLNHEFNIERTLGEIELTKEDKEVKYKIKLFDHIYFEEVLKTLTPCLAGKIISSTRSKDTNRLIIEEFEITSVGLCAYPADPSLKALGDL